MGELRLASAGDDIRLWDCAQGYSLIKQFNPHGHNISCLAFSHDYSTLASTSTGGGKMILTYLNNLPNSHDIAVGAGRTCLAFNSTSRYIMGGGPDGVINVWDLKTHKLKKSYSDHKSEVTSVTFNWNDTDIASGSQSGEIILYNVVSGLGSSALAMPKAQAVQQVKYSMFKKSLLGAVSDDGAVNLWDTNRRCLVHSFSDQHKAPATGLVFSPLNEMLMMSVGLDKRIVCYDVQNKIAVRTMVAESPLTSIDLMHDGATLAVGSTRGKIYIYDLRQGATPLTVLSAHKSSVQCLKFQNNSKIHKVESHGRKGTVASTAKRQPSTTTSSTKGVTNGSHRNINGSVRADINANQPEVTTQAAVHQLVKLSRHRHHRTNLAQGARSHSTVSGSVTEQTNYNDFKEPGMNSVNVDLDYRSEIFSPIHDRLDQPRWTPKTDRTPHRASPSPCHGSAGQAPGDKLEYIPHKSNVPNEKHLDPIFSPIGGSEDPLRNDPSVYAGGNISWRTPTLPVTTHMAPDFDLAHHDRNLDEYSETNGRLAGGMSSGSRSQASSKSSLLPDEDSLPNSTEDLRSKGQVPRSRSNQSKFSLSTPDEYQSVSASGTGSLSSLNKDQGSLSSISTPPDATLTTPGTDAETASGAAAAAALGSFRMEVIQNIVQESIDELRDQMRKDILNLYMEMIKQFQIQQAETRMLMQQYSLNEGLVAEIERLKEENKRLKQKF